MKRFDSQFETTGNALDTILSKKLKLEVRGIKENLLEPNTIKHHNASSAFYRCHKACESFPKVLKNMQSDFWKIIQSNLNKLKFIT